MGKKVNPFSDHLWRKGHIPKATLANLNGSLFMKLMGAHSILAALLVMASGDSSPQKVRGQPWGKDNCWVVIMGKVTVKNKNFWEHFEAHGGTNWTIYILLNITEIPGNKQ